MAGLKRLNVSRELPRSLWPWPPFVKLWHPLKPSLLRHSKVPFSRPQIFGTCFGGFRSYSGYGRRLRGVVCQAWRPLRPQPLFFFKAFKGAIWQTSNAQNVSRGLRGATRAMAAVCVESSAEPWHLLRPQPLLFQAFNNAIWQALNA